MTNVNIENAIQRPNIRKTIISEWKGVLSEFVATTMLIFFGCMSSIPIENIQNSPLYAPLGFGFTVMFNVQIFGHISGAFMNPFVTIIAVIWGRISIFVGVMYVIAECVGAILGYGLLVSMAHSDVAGDGVCVTAPHAGLNDFQSLGIEIILSLGLSLITCAVWDPVNKDNTDSTPLKFGLTIVGLSIAGGPLTGASMNPARSLGPAVWSNRWDSHWVYWAGPLIGGIVPAIFYKYAWKKKEDPKLQS